jgi:hypothetical protein
MENEILRVMQQAPGMRFSGKEIGRIVDRNVFREDPHWARPLLEKLVVERSIWRDEGYYLYPTDEQKMHQRVTPGTFRPAEITTHRPTR